MKLSKIKNLSSSKNSSTVFEIESDRCVDFYQRAALKSTLIGFASALVLVGCASKPIPTEQFAISKSAIDSATSAGADQYAPLEIKSAREKLTSAERAVNEKNYEVAAALAEESTIDAKLAEAKSESEKSKKSVEEIDKNLRTLMDESNRSQQLMQPVNQSQPR